MRHQNAGRKLNRTSAHRTALLRNLVAALIHRERIRTTDAKAKELRRVADRMVTLGKQGTLAARRRAFDRLRDRVAVQKLFGEIAPRFKDRAGGYTRIVKIGLRAGDAAPLSLIEWTTSADGAGKPERGKKKPVRRGRGAGETAAPPRKKAAAG